MRRPTFGRKLRKNPTFAPTPVPVRHRTESHPANVAAESTTAKLLVIGATFDIEGGQEPPMLGDRVTLLAEYRVVTVSYDDNGLYYHLAPLQGLTFDNRGRTHG